MTEKIVGARKHRISRHRNINHRDDKRSVTFIKKPNVLLVDTGDLRYVKKHVETITGLPMLGRYNYDLAGHNLYKGDYIADLLDVKETPTGKIEHLMQYIPGQSLDARLPYLTIEDKINIGYDMIKSVSEIHRKELIHADIKLENFVYDGINAVLIDFDSLNLAEVFDKHAKQSLTYGFSGGGTYLYAPPEQFKGCVVYGSDIYSLGVSLGELFYGNLPERAIHIATNDADFASHFIDTLSQNQNNLSYKEIGFNGEKEFINLIRQTINFNSECRPSAEELEDQYLSIFRHCLNK